MPCRLIRQTQRTLAIIRSSRCGTTGGPAQNAYFFTVNTFSSPTTFTGVHVYALDRASMLTGGPANAISFGLTAADVGASYSFVAATANRRSAACG